MMLYNSFDSYGSLSKFFHWGIGFLILGLLAAGLIMTEIEPSPLKWSIYSLHKATGLVVLALVLVRFTWRQLNAIPALPNSIPKWQRNASSFTHIMLYTLMFMIPITGFFMSFLGGHAINFYGILTIPPLDPNFKFFSKIFNSAHRYFAYAMIILIGMHIAAALYHHFWRKDSILTRILPKFLGKRSRNCKEL